MKKYNIDNDEVIYANTPEEFMINLRKGSMFDYKTPDIIYQKEFFERIETMYGKTINCKVGDFDCYIKELIRVGFIKSVEIVYE
jgi:hypothetical protein